MFKEINVKDQVLTVKVLDTMTPRKPNKTKPQKYPTKHYENTNKNRI